MGIDFYYTSGSPPCHAVQMTAKAVGVELNQKVINLATGEHLKPEFIKVYLLLFPANSVTPHFVLRYQRFQITIIGK